MKRQYLRTERAHFMCPNMHFAIMAETKGVYNKEKIHRVLTSQAAAHPFLRSRIQKETDTDRLYYEVEEESQIFFEEITDSRTYADIMNDISQNEWNVFENGMLKIFAFAKEENTRLLFVVHHLLCDGRGLLKLVEEFSDAYGRGKEPTYAQEHLIATPDELPKDAKLSSISRMLVRNANKKWKKENKKIDYELYKKVSNAYGRTHRNTYEERAISGQDLRRLYDNCHKNKVSMNDWLCAEIGKQYQIKKLIIAADIRAALPFYQEGALGNYATAFSIMPKCKGTVSERAKEIQKLKQSALSNNAKNMMILACYMDIEPTLLDAAAASALGGFKSKAGYFVGATMFHLDRPTNYSITNLGKVNSETLLSAMFIPPASPATIMTVGVVTVNDVMRICSSKAILINEK